MKTGISWKIIKLNTFFYKKYCKLKLGNNTLIFGKQEFTRGGNIFIGDNTRISRWCVFREYGGKIKIGNNCSINSFCHFSGNGDITIGNNVLIATQCVLISANHNFNNVNLPISQQGETRKKIIIEDDVWLGAGVKVLAGVTIGQGSVIGAGAVVTKDIPAFSVCYGVPAVVRRTRK